MIKANELRIGNIINVINRAPVVVTADHIKSISEGDKDYSPISLTPEWLERCGFKQKPPEPDDLPQWQNLNMNIAQYTDGFYLYTITSDPWHDQAVGNKIEYVHTLQNISLDLFGEELKIEL